jgi:hypothetical protein
MKDIINEIRNMKYANISNYDDSLVSNSLYYILCDLKGNNISNVIELPNSIILDILDYTCFSLDELIEEASFLDIYQASNYEELGILLKDELYIDDAYIDFIDYNKYGEYLYRTLPLIKLNTNYYIKKEN